MRRAVALALVVAAFAAQSCGDASEPVSAPIDGPCPVTKPASGQRPAAMVSLLRGDVEQTAGHGHLWVVLPPEAANASGSASGSTFTVKLPWFLNGPGALEISGRRLDGRGTLSGSVAYDEPGEEPRMQAASVQLSTLGCHEVRGEHAGEVVTIVFAARAT